MQQRKTMILEISPF
jgi:hypothetical protein